MNDVLRALGISAGILFPVVVLFVIVTIVAVKRGEAGHLEPAHDVPEPAPPVKAAGKAGAASDEISVSLILLLGLGLFTVTILALLVVSLIAHS